MTPMLGTRSTPWFGITTRSRAISRAPAISTAGSGQRFGHAPMSTARARRPRPIPRARYRTGIVAGHGATHAALLRGCRRGTPLRPGRRPAAHEPAAAEPGDQAAGGRRRRRAAASARPPASRSLRPGTALLDEARALLDQADRLRVRVAAAAGAATLTVGILGDSADPAATRLAAAYRRQPSRTSTIRVRDADLTDPTCGLRAGLVDVALTRAPFDETGLTCTYCAPIRSGAVLRADDPLARRDPAARWPTWPTAAGSSSRRAPTRLAVVLERRRTPREGPGRARRPGVPAGRAVERHGRPGAARTRPARGADRGAADRHAAEPACVVAWNGQRAAGPVVRPLAVDAYRG